MFPLSCGATTFFCTVRHCAYLSLWHNWNVQHSDDELNLRDLHIHVPLGLLELELHVHREVTHAQESPRSLFLDPLHNLELGNGVNFHNLLQDLRHKNEQHLEGFDNLLHKRCRTRPGRQRRPSPAPPPHRPRTSCPGTHFGSPGRRPARRHVDRSISVHGGDRGSWVALLKEATPNGQVLKATQGSSIVGPTRCPCRLLAGQTRDPPAPTGLCWRSRSHSCLRFSPKFTGICGHNITSGRTEGPIS